MQILHLRYHASLLTQLASEEDRRRQFARLLRDRATGVLISCRRKRLQFDLKRQYPVRIAQSVKHQWLFLNTLDTVSRIEKLVAFYVDEHNTRLPHSAFRGQTPDEMYFGTGDRIPDELDGAKKAARQSRMEVNRATLCPMCQPFDSTAN